MSTVLQKIATRLPEGTIRRDEIIAAVALAQERAVDVLGVDGALQTLHQNTDLTDAAIDEIARRLGAEGDENALWETSEDALPESTREALMGWANCRRDAAYLLGIAVGLQLGGVR